MGRSGDSRRDSALAPTPGAAVCSAAITCVQNATGWLSPGSSESQAVTDPAAGAAASHSASERRLAEPGRGRDERQLGLGSRGRRRSVRCGRGTRPRRPPRGVELGARAAGLPGTASCSVRGSSCDPTDAVLGDGLDGRPGGRGSVSPFTSAWTWLSISASISGSQSQFSGVIASSNIGRNSCATGSWIADVRLRDRRVGLQALDDGLVDLGPARVLEERVDAVTVRPRLAGNAKPAQARIGASRRRPVDTRGRGATCRSNGTVGVPACSCGEEPCAVVGHRRLPLQEELLHRGVVRRRPDPSSRTPDVRRSAIDLGRPRSIRDCRIRPGP